MIKERFSEIRKIMLSKKAKKITSTVAVTFAVCLFFIWLGVGMYVSVPLERREELWPMLGLYCVFPALIFFFGTKKVYTVINNEEDPDEDENE